MAFISIFSSVGEHYCSQNYLLIPEKGVFSEPHATHCHVYDFHYYSVCSCGMYVGGISMIFLYISENTHFYEFCISCVITESCTISNPRCSRLSNYYSLTNGV